MEADYGCYRVKPRNRQINRNRAGLLFLNHVGGLLRAGLAVTDRPLNIVHVFRSPVGGLFRHVLDLAGAQAARGHRVGLIADSLTGGERADHALAALEPQLALGLIRTPMPRQPGPKDIKALMAVSRFLRASHVDVAHGHGGKGGLYARLARAGRPIVRAMTPHGGSLHFNRDNLGGWLVLTTEQLLMPFGDLYLFESRYSRDLFNAKIGTPRGLVRVVHNGVSQSEFEPVPLAPDATDLLYLGEFRILKGIDVLVDAVGKLRARGHKTTATLVGDGPDAQAVRDRIARANLGDAIRLRPPMPAREAFALGRIMVVPSRAESLPYVVLEAAACGKPLIATAVGGIPEIYGPLTDALIPPNDPEALAKTLAIGFENPGSASARAAALRQRIAEGFSVDTMVDGVLAGYAEARLKGR
jgi:glycosyltransferase involved in cell wall biosynthesis